MKGTWALVVMLAACSGTPAAEPPPTTVSEPPTTAAPLGVTIDVFNRGDHDPTRLDFDVTVCELNDESVVVRGSGDPGDVLVISDGPIRLLEVDGAQPLAALPGTLSYEVVSETRLEGRALHMLADDRIVAVQLTVLC